MIQFLLPSFFAGCLFLGLPILLHLLRRKPTDQVVFPTLRFLGPSALQDSRQHRLRRWITLLLRCLALAFLALAFVRPFLPSLSGPHHLAMVIALDNSYSLQAKDRWTTLQGWALQQLKTLQPGDQAAILLVNPNPAWLVPMTDNLSLVRDTLKNRLPGFQTTRFDPALRLAANVLNQTIAAKKELLWVTDHQRLGWSGVDFNQTLPPGVTLKTPGTVPDATRQAAITQASVTRSASGWKVEGSLRLFTPTSDSRQLTVAINGQTVSTQKIDLTADLPSHFSIPLTNLTPPAYLHLSLDPDDLSADAHYYLVAEAPPASKVLIDEPESANGEADFLNHAILATGSLDQQSLTPAPLPTTTWPINSPVILRSDSSFTGPTVGLLDDFLKRGGHAWIWVQGGPKQTAWLQARRIEISPLHESPSTLRDLDLEHPALSFFGEEGVLPLLKLQFQQGWTLRSAELNAIARWQDQSISIGELDSASAHLCICGFNPTRASSDWPLQSSFVPFVHRILLWLGAVSTPQTHWMVGDKIAPTHFPCQWTAIDTPRALSVPGQKVEGPLSPEIPGVYRLEGGGEARYIAVNVNPEEADLSPWPHASDWQKLISLLPANHSTDAAPLQLPQSTEKDTWWWWLFGLALLFLLAELLLANRTSL